MTTEPIDWNDRDHLVAVHTETGERWTAAAVRDVAWPDKLGHYLVYSHSIYLWFHTNGRAMLDYPYRIENGTVDQRIDEDQPFDNVLLAKLEPWKTSRGAAAEIVCSCEESIAKRKSEAATSERRPAMVKPFEEMPLAELKTQRAYWQSKIDNASEWGAAVGAAAGLVRCCDAWIAKQKTEVFDQRPTDIPQSAWDAAEGRSREDVARMIAVLKDGCVYMATGERVVWVDRVKTLLAAGEKE